MDKTELLIKLGVDSSGASKQISEINKELKSMDKELKSLDTSTDNFNTNMSNMGKKADVAKNKITALQAKLDAQNKALEQANKKYQNALKAQERYNNGTEKSASETAKHKKAVEQAASQVNKYNREIADTERALNSANQELAEMNAQIAKMPYEKMAKGFQNVSDGLGKVSQATKPLTVALGGIATASINTAMSFEDSMAKISATTGATGYDLEKLEEKAREIGKTTSLSAEEGATALLYLSQAGYDTQQSLSAVDDVVNLAIAANMDLGEATKIVTANLASYKISVDDASRVTDVLAQTASSSNTNVQELGQAFEVIAPVAGALGYSIEDTSLALALLANNAISGSTAGTALRSILSKLVDPTKECQTAMEKYGISLVNSDGTAKSLKDVLGNLKTAFSSLDETQKAELASTLAGQEGMSALLAIVNSSDEDFNKLSESIDNANGKTEAMAKTMAETSKGGLKELLSKLQEAFITIGQKLLPIFDQVVDKLGEALDWFNNLDEGMQENIIKWGLFVASISPVTGILSELSGGFGSLVGKIGELVGKKALAQTATGIAEVGTQALTATSGITGAGGLVVGFSSLATAIAPWLIGGALVVGLGLGLKKIHDDMVEAGKQSALLAEGFEGDIARMNEANRLLTEEFDTKYQEVKGTMETFKTEGSTLLAEAFANAQEPTSINLDNFNTLVDGKLKETLGIIEENRVQMGTDLALFNTNYANQSILGWDTINAITDGKSKEMEKHVQVAYDNMINTQKQSALIGQEITDEYGNTIVYTSEMYYNDLQKAYDEYCDETLKAQVGFYGDELFAQETFINDSGAKTYQQYQEQLKDAKTQRDDLKAVADEHYEDQMTVIQQLSDDELETMGFTREQLIEIAQLQREQYYQEAEGMYQDAKATYTEMAEDTTTITDDQRKNTIENAKKAKEGTTKEISEAQERINEILRQAGYDVDEYGNIIERTSENARNEFSETADTVEREKDRINRAIQQLQDKTINIKAKFTTEGYENFVKQTGHVVTDYGGKFGWDPSINDSLSGVNAYAISPYADFFGGMNAESYPTFDFYGLKDTGIKTLSLSSLGLDTVSSYATSDSNATGNISTINYNYGGSIATTTKTDSGLGSKLDKLISLIAQQQAGVIIQNMQVDAQSKSTDQIMREISSYLNIHKKRW